MTELFKVYLSCSPCSHQVAEDLFDSWLVVEGRQVTRPQKEVVRDSLRAGAHPLFLRLVLAETRSWTSFADADRKLVPAGSGSDVTAACEAFFDRLESRHGSVMVRKTVGYLLAAR